MKIVKEGKRELDFTLSDGVPGRRGLDLFSSLQFLVQSGSYGELRIQSLRFAPD